MSLFFRNFSPSYFVAADDLTRQFRGCMRALLSNLTAVLLVIHAMIGCCHHHWHSDAECAAAATISAAPCQCCDPCCGSNDESEQPSHPCDGKLECQGVCNYVPTEKTQIDASPADAAFDFAAAIPTLLGGHLAAATLSWDRAHTLNDSPPPLRLHLLHQILLI
jgi:hypothetical protein